MSILSQSIIEIMQYASLAGIIASGVSVLAVRDIRKKVIFFFLFFIATAIFSFVFYSGATFLMSAFPVLFVFLVANQLVNEVYMVRTGPAGITRQQQDIKRDDRKSIFIRIIIIVLPVFLFGAMGYLVYHYSNDYPVEWKNFQDVPIAGVGQLAEQISGYYGILVIIILSALFISFIWLTIIPGHGLGKRDGDTNEQ